MESGAIVNLNLGMALIYRNSQLKIFLVDWYLERTLKSQFSHLVSLTGCLVLETGTISQGLKYWENPHNFLYLCVYLYIKSLQCLQKPEEGTKSP